MFKNCIVYFILVLYPNSGNTQLPMLEQVDDLNDKSSLLVIEDPYRRLNDTSLTNWIIQDKDQINSFLLSFVYSDSTDRFPTNASKEMDHGRTVILYQGDSMVASGVYYPQSNYFYLDHSKIYYKCKSDQYEKYKQISTHVNHQYFSTNDLKEARKVYNSLRSNDSVVLFHLPYGKPQWLDYDGFFWFTLLNPDSIGLTMDSLQNYLNSKYSEWQFELAINGEDKESRSIEIRTFKSFFDQVKDDPITWSVEKLAESHEYEYSFIISYPIEKNTGYPPSESIIRRLKREIKKTYSTSKFDIQCDSGGSDTLHLRIKSSETFMNNFDLYPKGNLSWRPYGVAFSYWILK